MNTRTSKLFLLMSLVVTPQAWAANESESPATRFANEAGQIAGAATFCQFEAEDLENYKTRALAKVAADAKDDVDLVVSNIAFSNALASGVSKEPEGGCEAFTELFLRSAARLD